MVAPDKRNKWDQPLADGTTITVANSDDTGDNAIAATNQAGDADAQYKVNASFAGITQAGARVWGTTTSPVFQLTLTGTAAQLFSAQVYFKCGTNERPTGATPRCLCRIRSSGANAAILVMQSSGVVTIQNGAGSGLKNFNSNTAITDGDYYANIAADRAASPTTTNGNIYCEIRRVIDDSLVDSLGATGLGVNTGTTEGAALNQAQTGKPTGGDVYPSSGVACGPLAVKSGTISFIDAIVTTGTWTQGKEVRIG